MQRIAPVLLTLVLLLVGAAPVRAQEAEPAALDDAHRLELRTERVVVFKDGHCLVVREGVATSDEQGRVFTEEVPDAAILGSFWATPVAGRLHSMTADVEEVVETSTEEVACEHYVELLVANEGKQATVTLDDGEELEGVLRAALTTESEQPVPVPGVHPNPWQPAPPTGRTVSRLTGSLFVIGTDDGDVALPVSRLRGLTVREMTVTRERTTTTTSQRKRLTLRFEGGAAERRVRLLYFRPGVRWIPTYRFDVDPTERDEKRGTLRLQAELLNEAEDLVDVPVDLVVGVPNFRFQEVVSPFVLERALQNALAHAAPHLMGQQMLGGGSNAFGNRAGEWRGPSTAHGGTTGAVELPGELTAGRSQDLFVYSLPRMTLRRGERAAVPVFESEVPYRDVYTWDLQLKRSDNEAAPGGVGVSPLTLSQNRIWHQLELTNAGDVPWTTGACLLLDGVQPLGQELLTYTASGARVRVPVTVAIDVRGDVAEQETARELSALTWNRTNYARIEKTAAVTVTNFKADPIDLEVTVAFGGRATSATHDGEITLGAFRAEDWEQYSSHPAVNNHSDVRFVLRLEPGASTSPEIALHYFTRH